MKVIKECFEKNRQELIKDREQTKKIFFVYTFIAMVLFVFGLFSMSFYSWKLGEMAMLTGIAVFVLTTQLLVIMMGKAVLIKMEEQKTKTKTKKKE